MTYKQIVRLDYVQLQYEQFIYTSVKRCRKPFRIMVFDNTHDRTTLVILSKNVNEIVSTRTMTFTRKEADDVLEMFKRDFEKIEIEKLESLV